MTPTLATDDLDDLDALDPRALSPEARAALRQFRSRQQLLREALAGLGAARADLTAAIGSGDPDQTAAVAARVREAEILAEAVTEPSFADCAAYVRTAFADVSSRFAREVMDPRRNGFEPDRASIAQRWRGFQAMYQGWHREGSDASTALALLKECSFFHAWVDRYALAHPPERRPDDALAHAVAKPALEFVYLGDR
jgi:hypothetical protein